MTVEDPFGSRAARAARGVGPGLAGVTVPARRDAGPVMEGPATDGSPLTQGDNFKNPAPGRKAKIEPKSGSTLHQVDLLDAGAPRDPPDPLDDLGAVEEELVADDRVGGVDDQPSPLVHAHRVRVGGVRRADDLGPLVADRLLGRR